VERYYRKVRFLSTIELVNAFELEKLKCKAGRIAESLNELDLVIFQNSDVAVQRVELDDALPHHEQILRPNQRGHHHKSQLQGMGHGL
jgi:hypothetical protein